MTNVPTLRTLFENTEGITSKKINATFERMVTIPEIDLVHYVGACIIKTKSGSLYVVGPVKGIYNLFESSGALRDVIKVPNDKSKSLIFDEGIFLHSTVLANGKTRVMYSGTTRDKDGDIVLRSELPKFSSVIEEIRIAPQEVSEA